MIYECLIHLPSKTFCAARTVESVAVGNVWSATESDPSGEFRIASVDLSPMREDFEVEVYSGVLVMASQIDSALIGGA